MHIMYPVLVYFVGDLSQELGVSHEVSSKGLNTESNNPQRASATGLAKIAAGQHNRDEHTMLPRFRAPLER